MSNYRQENVSGVRHMRAYRIVCDNDLTGDRGIAFEEERVTSVGDSVDRVAVGSVREPFITEGDDANLTEQFALLHPVTGDVIGSATYQEVYVMLHSLYYHVAQKRDGQQP